MHDETFQASELTKEERLIWDCARHWRTPDRIAFPVNPEWDRVVEIALANKMATLLSRILDDRALWGLLPSEARGALKEAAEKNRKNARLYRAALAQYLAETRKQGIDTILLKGIYVSERLYGDPAMRPGGDIDVLVRPEHVEGSISVLDRMEIGQHWPNLMDDRYYARHHLHQQRCSEDLSLWFEIHWALDHPYTLLTIDYEAILERATPGELLGLPVLDPDPADLILTLVVHLVKHAIYLPSSLSRPDLDRVTLADGMLMYYLDIVEALRAFAGRLDWEAVTGLAQETGTAALFGAVFRFLVDHFGAEIPTKALADLPVAPAGRTTARAMEAVIEHSLSVYLGETPGRFWTLMLSTNGAFILRPVRILETASYLLPPQDFLARKYGRTRILARLGHFARAVVQFARFGWDSVYFAVERYFRLRRIGYSTSLFNRLETDG